MTLRPTSLRNAALPPLPPHAIIAPHMCGLTGAIWKQGPDPALVGAMTQRLAHRGPVDEQLWQSGDVALGFRRLGIIDPEHGRQPVESEDGTIVAVCNGEIYNHRAHRDALGRAGHCFRSDCDAEVIPHLYEQHGPDFTRHLHGKFAILLVDTRRRLLVAATRAPHRLRHRPPHGPRRALLNDSGPAGAGGNA